MIDKTKRDWISKRFKLLVFERFGIKANDLDLKLIESCIEISEHWASVNRFNQEDKWHVCVIDSIINCRLDTLEPLYKK
jgi:hypothetical protein